jgi:hypothetical protein
MRPGEGHSLPGDGRGRDLSEHGKKQPTAIYQLDTTEGVTSQDMERK